MATPKYSLRSVTSSDGTLSLCLILNFGIPDQIRTDDLSDENRMSLAARRPGYKLAEALGIEPRTTESKSVVIPFHYAPIDL